MNNCQVVADLEAATWQAIRHVMLDVKVWGCLFHFTQTIFQKNQELTRTHVFCRNLMSLPFLPSEHIQQIFAGLILDQPVPSLRALGEHVCTTWINGQVFTPCDWSVFGLLTRTNNNVERWHYRMNYHGNDQDLLPLLNDCRSYGQNMVLVHIQPVPCCQLVINRFLHWFKNNMLCI